MATTTAPTAAVTEAPTWHILTAQGATQELHVEPELGLTTEEAAQRLARYGPNKFAEAKSEPRWHAFLRQYRDPMQIVLLAAGVISIYPVKQPGTGIMILALTLLNAVLGLSQEGKAAAAVAALAKMMIIKARVRRAGRARAGRRGGRRSGWRGARGSRWGRARWCGRTGGCCRRRPWRSPRRR